MTPFSKVKTWIKQGFYEKLPSSKSLRGALDLEQEIMDTLVRKGLATTEDCCTYTSVGGAGYSVYTALLTQTGTDAPIATVLENTLGGTVVWTRQNDGEYNATLAGAFTVGKTWFSVCATYGLFDYIAQFGPIDINTSLLYIADSSFVPHDNWSNVSIEIRVYP